MRRMREPEVRCKANWGGINNSWDGIEREEVSDADQV